MTRLRVLVIDDLVSMRRTLQRALEHDGYEVLTAANGDEASDILRGTDVDVVLMDLRMPKMSGRTLYQLIRSQWPDLARRVVVMSGDPDSNEYRDWLALHDLPVLAKPFRLHDMRRIIAMLAERRAPDVRDNHA